MKNLLGEKFNRWTVLSFDCYIGKGKNSKWICICDCGKIKSVYGYQLRSGITTPCGCYRNEAVSKAIKTHGMKNTKEWRTWQSMKQRCCYKKSKSYHNYGGRGIRICSRWLNSFENFYNDMGKRPDGKTLDRIDNDGNYEPGNCRWATASEQAKNTRKSLNKKQKTLIAHISPRS